jgi:ArsR family transcriptional regulator, lead/cadmium/zinc/bismuth-responsive transcriptional repressor
MNMHSYEQVMTQDDLLDPGVCECDTVSDAEVQAARGGLIETQVAQDLAAVFKALSDPTRLRIISALAGREFCVNDLAAALGLGQSAISHQLSDMRDLRLVRFRRAGRHVFYTLDDEHVRDLFDQGMAHIQHR